MLCGEKDLAEMIPLKILMPMGTNHEEFKSIRGTQKKEVTLLAVGA